MDIYSGSPDFLKMVLLIIIMNAGGEIRVPYKEAEKIIGFSGRLDFDRDEKGLIFRIQNLQEILAMLADKMKLKNKDTSAVDKILSDMEKSLGGC